MDISDPLMANVQNLLGLWKAMEKAPENKELREECLKETAALAKDMEAHPLQDKVQQMSKLLVEGMTPEVKRSLSEWIGNDTTPNQKSYKVFSSLLYALQYSPTNITPDIADCARALEQVIAQVEAKKELISTETSAESQRSEEGSVLVHIPADEEDETLEHLPKTEWLKFGALSQEWRTHIASLINRFHVPVIELGIETGLALRRFLKVYGKDLTCLNLDNCDFLADDDLKALKGCDSLSILIIGDCLEITDVGISHIKVLKQLKDLEIARCPKVTDHSLSLIAHHCSSLQTLILQNLKTVSDSSIALFAKLCPYLCYVRLVDCQKIGNRSIAKIAEHCYHLRLLDIHGTPLVNDESLSLLEKQCPELEYINLGGTKASSACRKRLSALRRAA